MVKGRSKSIEKEIAVLGDEDTVIGFSLAGIKLTSIIYDDTEEREIKERIKELIANPDIGFILITERIAERIRTDFELLKLDKSLYPIFIELPDKHGEIAEREDPIRALIRRAIGMEVVKAD